MTNADLADPDRIKAQLDRDRAALRASAATLRARLTPGNLPETLLDDGLRLIRRNAGPCLDAVDATVRAKPIATAMVGVGLAWLLFGPTRRTAPPDPENPLAGTRYEALTRWEDEGGPVADPPELPDADPAAGPPDDWMAEADRARDRARRLLARIDHALRARLAPEDALLRHRAEVMDATAAAVRGALARGLDDLGDKARARALAAREAAYLARVEAARAGARRIRETPLLAGCLLAGAGAALAALLPGTRLEDRMFGEARDRLADETRIAVGAETRRLTRMASAVAEILAEDLATDPAGRARQHRSAPDRDNLQSA